MDNQLAEDHTVANPVRAFGEASLSGAITISGTLSTVTSPSTSGTRRAAPPPPEAGIRLSGDIGISGSIATGTSPAIGAEVGGSKPWAEKHPMAAVVLPVLVPLVTILAMVWGGHKIDFLFNNRFYFSAFIVSGGGGALASAVTYLLLIKWAFRKENPAKNLDHVGIITGIIERFFFTCAMVLTTNGIVQAAIAWIVIKAQINYQVFTKAPNGNAHDYRCKMYPHLLGSSLSILCALAGGFMWTCKYTLETFWPLIHWAHTFCHGPMPTLVLNS